MHTESIQEIIKNNPDATIITNSGVSALLAEKNILSDILEHGQQKQYDGLLMEGYGKIHAEIFGEIGRVQNTGYLVENKFFYPGDAFTNPEKPIEILALPVAGPWMSIKEAINYVKEVQPKYCFPVHDGVLSKEGKSVHYNWIKRTLDEGVEFIPLDEGQNYNFN